MVRTGSEDTGGKIAKGGNDVDTTIEKKERKLRRSSSKEVKKAMV